ncbi:MAG: hypothetical protein RI929_491 [Actinomycetota bacterium]
MSDADRIAKKLGVSATENGPAISKQSLLDAIGGRLGIAESIIPAFSFSVAFAISKSAVVSVAVASGLALLFIVIRVIRKQPVTQAIAGALAIALAAFLALRDGGNAEDYFVPGFITNAAYGSVLLLSVLVRYPIMGFVAQLLFGIENWRKNRTVYRRAQLVTLVWVGFFCLRLAVQLPLYFSQQVELLAASKVVLGAPAYAGLLVLTWVLLKSLVNSQKQ